MTKTSETSRNTLINILKASGVWAEDRWGNFKYTGSTLSGDYRFKFNTTSVRFEKKVVFDSGSVKSDWINIASDYYKNIKFVEDKVSFGKKTLNNKIFQ